MKPEYQETIEEYTYKVYIDQESVEDSYDCGNEEENKAYLERFKSGELTSYYIEKLKECPCCRQLEVIDSCSGIHERTAKEALDCYLDNYENDEEEKENNFKR